MTAVSVDQDCVKHTEPPTVTVGQELNWAKFSPARVKEACPDLGALPALALVKAGAS